VSVPVLTPTVTVSNWPSSLSVSIDWTHAHVELVGELDGDTAHLFLDALEALAATQHAFWTIDATGLSWCDARGVRAIAAGLAVAAGAGCELRVVAASRCVHRLLTLTGLDELMAASTSRVRPEVPPAPRRPEPHAPSRRRGGPAVRPFLVP
jgi:anti-sigma B factor antagonist